MHPAADRVTRHLGKQQVRICTRRGRRAEQAQGARRVGLNALSGRGKRWAEPHVWLSNSKCTERKSFPHAKEIYLHLFITIMTNIILNVFNSIKIYLRLFNKIILKRQRRKERIFSKIRTLLHVHLAYGTLLLELAPLLSDPPLTSRLVSARLRPPLLFCAPAARCPTGSFFSEMASGSG
jgi:hypothetical protein